MQAYLQSNLKVNLLPHVAYRLPQVTDEDVYNLAMNIASKAYEFSPVLTGALRESIRVEERGQHSYAIVAGGGAVDYGMHQEYGTIHHAPHPFMRPAAVAGTAILASVVGGNWEVRLLN